MKVIDKRGKEEKQIETAITNKVVERDETLIEVHPDWRITNELQIMKEDHERWSNGTPGGKERFLQAAIANRDTLDALEIQDYDRENAKHIASQERLICKVDKETIDTLTAEARTLHLDLDGYMRALTYSYAKMLRAKRVQQEKVAEEMRIANTPLNVLLPLPKRLQAALFVKYPLTEDQERSLSDYPYMVQGYIKERLLQLVEETMGE
jgi:hypothetical protein